MELFSYQDIFTSVCNFINLNKLITLESLSTNHKKIIRTNCWMNITINTKHEQKIKFVIKHYCFVKYDFSYNLEITDDIVSQLHKCHTLNLSWTNITDLAIKNLGNCHVLSLSSTDITDFAIKK